MKNVDPRLPIEVLVSNSLYKKQRGLFLQGFAEVQKRDTFNTTSFYAQKRDASNHSFSENDPTSYYAVASIHGLLYEPYDLLPEEDIKPTDWHLDEGRRPRGYCYHGDILFPTWHRPYVMLLEMLIYEAAKNIVNSPHLQVVYSSIFFDETVDVESPTGKTTIRNSLCAFTLPRDLGTLSLVGDESNPTQRPYKPDPRYATIRNPDSNYTSAEKLTSLTIGIQSSSVFHPSIYQVLHYAKNWHQFSNHSNSPDTLSNGGTSGHMAYPNVAAFNPIFFLHHCNMDRLVAIWQAINPNAWIEDDEVATFSEGTFTEEPYKKITEKTNLTPFKKTETDYWTSDNVRYIEKLGYTYPKLQEFKDSDLSRNNLKTNMMEYYYPNLYTFFFEKSKVGSPFELCVFIDLPNANSSTRKSSPNFAGLVSIFAHGNETLCAKCLSQPDAVVNGSVDLTTCMQRLDVNLNLNNPNNPNNSGLKPEQITIIAALSDGTGIDLEDAGLVNADYWVFDEGPGHTQDYVNWTQKYIENIYKALTKSVTSVNQ
ncbi:19345_t:CDS:2 [Gigaspora rosea]|nr:19345_t:CDS:2 [Gigaspora rosea]